MHPFQGLSFSLPFFSLMSNLYTSLIQSNIFIVLQIFVVLFLFIKNVRKNEKKWFIPGIRKNIIVNATYIQLSIESKSTLIPKSNNHTRESHRNYPSPEKICHNSPWPWINQMKKEIIASTIVSLNKTFLNDVSWN